MDRCHVPSRHAIDLLAGRPANEERKLDPPENELVALRLSDVE